MKTSATFLSLIAAVAAYPAPQAANLEPRDCTPGALVCQGSSKFALCTGQGQTTYMSVSEGTECVCKGSDCTIASVKGSGSGSDSGSTPPPEPSSGDDGSDSSAPPPKTTPPADPGAGAGGVFIEPVDETTDAPATPTEEPVTNPPQQQPKPTSTPPKNDGGSDNNSGSGSGSGSGSIPNNGGNYLKTFLGTGSSSDGWPSEDQWDSFDNMWESNLKSVIVKSCEQFGAENNSEQENSDLKSAIQSVASSSGVDERFILAVVMQESGACVRAPTSNYGVNNPGVMQSHDGSHSCENASTCSKSEIEGMIRDGVEGTSSGDGLKQILEKVSGSGAQAFYEASRIYNSGSIDGSGLLEDGIATHCYASDIANRLLGWSKNPSTCSLE